MAKLNEIELGQWWAYRARIVEAVVEVQVLAVGTKTPARVEVRFVGEAQEGATAWVPPSHLKVLWSESADFVESESQWRALGSQPDEIEESAVAAIVREFLWPAATMNWKKSERGTIAIFDDEIVDVFIGGGLDQLVQDVDSIVDARGINYGWSTAVAIARRVCSAKPERVMAYLHAEEAVARHSAPASYEAYTRLLREWCGSDVVKMWEELLAARKENGRLAGLLGSALALLVESGNPDASWHIWQTYSPGERKQDWEILVALELGRLRSGRQMTKPDRA